MSGEQIFTDFLNFFPLYSNIATKSAYEVSSRCLGRLESYNLVGWIMGGID